MIAWNNESYPCLLRSFLQTLHCWPFRGRLLSPQLVLGERSCEGWSGARRLQEIGQCCGPVRRRVQLLQLWHLDDPRQLGRAEHALLRAKREENDRVLPWEELVGFSHERHEIIRHGVAILRVLQLSFSLDLPRTTPSARDRDAR